MTSDNYKEKKIIKARLISSYWKYLDHENCSSASLYCGYYNGHKRIALIFLSKSEIENIEKVTEKRFKNYVINCRGTYYPGSLKNNHSL